MGRRQYSDEEKANTLLALDANRGNLSLTAAETGIPLTTIQTWRDGGVSRAVTELRNGIREPLADRLEALAHKCLDVLPGKIDTATASQIAFTLGMSVEKMRLLREQSTANVRADNINDDERVEEIAALRDRLRKRAVDEADQGTAVVN